jgi:hypothetical protein
MSIDELEVKIISIKKRGMNLLLENQLIAEVRGQYYDKLVDNKLVHISNQFRENIKYLAKLHDQSISIQKVKEFMGVELDSHLSKVIYNDCKLISLKVAIVASEFYGLPVELLLFQDLKSNAEILKELYPALFKQGRH